VPGGKALEALDTWEGNRAAPEDVADTRVVAGIRAVVVPGAWLEPASVVAVES